MASEWDALDARLIRVGLSERERAGMRDVFYYGAASYIEETFAVYKAAEAAELPEPELLARVHEGMQALRLEVHLVCEEARAEERAQERAARRRSRRSPR